MRGDLVSLGLVGLLAIGETLVRRGSRAFGDQGHWGRAGAGVLLTTGKKILILLRSDEVTELGTWNLAGGAVDPGESPLVAGLRELEEETSLFLDPDRANLVGQYVWQSPGSSFRYTTSVVRVPASWTHRSVELNWENDESMWVDSEWLYENIDDLHPGFRAALPFLWRMAFGEPYARS
jgi:8-oxo-dGTP pyrophosphatase MutT (NUDIX family)